MDKWMVSFSCTCESEGVIFGDGQVELVAVVCAGGGGVKQRDFPIPAGSAGMCPIHRNQISMSQGATTALLSETSTASA